MKKKHSMLKKYLKIFNVGLLCFLIVEAGILIFVDKSYLKENTGNVQVEHVTNNTSSDTADLKVQLTGSEKDIKASYDGKFIAYTLNNDLIIHNLKTDTKTTLKPDKDSDSGASLDINFYKWVYDRSKLVIAEKNKKTSKSYLKLYSIDAKKLAEDNEPEEIRNSVDNKTAKINLPSSSYDVSDLDFSTSTVTTYLKLTTGLKSTTKAISNLSTKTSSKSSSDSNSTSKYDTDSSSSSKSSSYSFSSSNSSKLWKFNMPYENKAYSKMPTKNIGIMQSLKYTDKLLYENLDKNTVNIAGEGVLTINGSKTYKIVGFDNKDNVYLAKGEDSTTDEIVYGSLMKESSDNQMTFITNAQFKTAKLPSKVPVKDIKVTLNGAICIDDSANTTVTNVLTEKKTSYSGKIIGYYAKGFLTIDSSNVVKQNPFA